MTSEERREARYRRRVEKRTANRQKRLSQYDNFELIADVDNLYTAFLKSKKGVAWKESVQRYEANAMRNIIDTNKRLLTGKNIQHGFVEFYLHERGKIRHIKSIHISERIVQKCLCDEVLVPILSNGLIYDNGASVKGKGVHFSLRRFIAHLSRFYRHNGYSNKGYYLAIDFLKFFDSIDHKLLLEMFENEITDKRVLELTKNFISVFGDGRSLGLGSQVSQISAIYFPNRLDHFIKEKLHIKYYGRYMDDLYLIHESKGYLKYCLKEIQKICGQLKITINMKKTRIEKLDHGIEFLKGKYKLLPTGKVLRLPGKASTKRMRRKLIKFKPLIDNGKMDYKDLRTAYQAWRGNYRRRFQAYHRIRYMDKLYNDLFINTHLQEADHGVSGKKR
jgi:retron-type reverse transcriptase